MFLVDYGEKKYAMYGIKALLSKQIVILERDICL